MSVTPEQLAEKRLQADQLRREISALDMAVASDQAVADLVHQDAALDEEIARLEAIRQEKMSLALRQGGGTVAEAIAAMEAAQEAAENEAAAKMPPSSRPALADNANTEGEGK